MDEFILRRETGEHRITVWHDSNASSPMTDWSLVGRYLYEYDRLRHLSPDCNWAEVWGQYGDCNHSMEETLRRLIEEHCDFGRFVKYIKDGEKEGTRLRYDRSARMWKLEVYEYWYKSKQWDLVEDIEPKELKDEEWGVFYHLLEYYGEKTLLEILKTCGRDIYAAEWGSHGYSQGDCVHGVAFVTKERYEELCGRQDIPWQQGALQCIDDEVKTIGRWMWGDVVGYMLERRVDFTKVYDDADRPDQRGHEWEFVDSCWGYYETPEELVSMVMEEHGLKEECAA